jgi:hypothetical protein
VLCVGGRIDGGARLVFPRLVTGVQLLRRASGVMNIVDEAMPAVNDATKRNSGSATPAFGCITRAATYAALHAPAAGSPGVERSPAAGPSARIVRPRPPAAPLAGPDLERPD